MSSVTSSEVTVMMSRTQDDRSTLDGDERSLRARKQQPIVQNGHPPLIDQVRPPSADDERPPPVDNEHPPSVCDGDLPLIDNEQLPQVDHEHELPNGDGLDEQASQETSVPTIVVEEKHYGKLGRSAADKAPKQRQLPPSVYFNDGRRLIDFVLAYEPDEGAARRRVERKRFREKFESMLLAYGLELEHEGKESSHDGKTAFVKASVRSKCSLRCPTVIRC